MPKIALKGASYTLYNKTKSLESKPENKTFQSATISDNNYQIAPTINWNSITVQTSRDEV